MAPPLMLLKHLMLQHTYLLNPRVTVSRWRRNRSTSKSKSFVEELQFYIVNPEADYYTQHFPMTITDPNETIEVLPTVRIGDGVLLQSHLDKQRY